LRPRRAVLKLRRIFFLSCRLHHFLNFFRHLNALRATYCSALFAARVPRRKWAFSGDMAQTWARPWFMPALPVYVLYVISSKGKLSSLPFMVGGRGVSGALCAMPADAQHGAERAGWTGLLVGIQR
jgi:hypothetical protein